MKKIIILFIALLICLPSVAFSGRKKAPKSGKIKDHVFTDAKYKFQITLPEGWKVKRSKRENVLRLTLKKEKNRKLVRKQTYKNPIMDVVNNGNYINIPIVNLWVLETELSSKDYLNSLTSISNKSEFRNKFIESINPVWSDATFKKFTTKKKEKLKFSEHEGYKWSGSYIHSYLVAENRADAPLGGAMYVIKNDDNSVVFISIKTEMEVIDEVIEELQPMLKSLKWNK